MNNNGEEKEASSESIQPLRGKKAGEFDERYSEAFFYWYVHGRSFTALSRDEAGEGVSARTWQTRAVENCWREEAAYLDRRRYFRIRKIVEMEADERVKYFTNVAVQALDNAIIYNEHGEIVDVGIQAESVADMDKIARLVLLLQGDADQHLAVTSFSDLMEKLGGRKSENGG